MKRPDLRLIVITDATLAAPRSIFDVVAEALSAGAPAIQLRDKQASAAELLEQAKALRELTAQYDALLFINDRIDIALVTRADGAHVGPADLPVTAARRIAPGLLIGYSSDDPESARASVAAGAAYIGCGAVFGTASKDVGDEQIGIAGLQRVVQAVTAPVIAIGGITPDNVEQVAAAGAAGCAVISAVMHAEQPGRVVAELLRAFV